MSLVVDIHTHMLNKEWLALLREHGGPHYGVKPVGALADVIHLDGAPFMTPLPEMFDYEARIRNMDKARVDIAVISLTCPNVYWGEAAVSLKAARLMNDDLAAAQRAWPDRIRWFASLPWQHEAAALGELERALGLGAVGVVVLANVAGRSLTDPAFARIWQALDAKKLPVFVHPTAPPGVASMDMATHNLVPPIGFVFDTSLALARCIYDGFLERYPNLRLIAGHGGGALPYLVGRLDICHERIPTCGARTKERPSDVMRRICVDTVLFREDAVRMCVDVCGEENVLYGSDYPHNIGDMAGCVARVDALGGELARSVRGRNAAKLLGLA